MALGLKLSLPKAWGKKNSRECNVGSDPGAHQGVSARMRKQKPGRSSRAPGAACRDDGIGTAFDQTRQTDLAVKLRAAQNLSRTKRAIWFRSPALARCEVFFVQDANPGLRKSAPSEGAPAGAWSLPVYPGLVISIDMGLNSARHGVCMRTTRNRPAGIHMKTTWRQQNDKRSASRARRVQATRVGFTRRETSLRPIGSFHLLLRLTRAPHVHRILCPRLGEVRPGVIAAITKKHKFPQKFPA